MTFWEKCHDYERLLADMAWHLNYKGPTEPDIWNNQVATLNLEYQIKQFWYSYPDQQRAYMRYVVSRSPLPKHFAYLWES